MVVVSTLKELRNDSEFSKFWTNVRERAIQLEVGEPILPRKAQTTKTTGRSNSTTFHDATPEDMYKRYYFELIDTVMGEIERRLNSPSFTLYTRMEMLLQSAAEGKEVCREAVQEVVEHFSNDLNLDDLCTELALLKNVMALMEFTYANLKRKVIEYGAILPHQVTKLLQLLLVVPATSATSEWSFSSLSLLKTFLRTTMSQSHLNHLILLYVHKDYTIN